MTFSKKWVYAVISFSLAFFAIVIIATTVNPVTPRIIGGRDAPDGKYPYMVSLRIPRNDWHFCGGSIIHKKWILTAAHCVFGKSNDSVKIVAGTNLRRGGAGQVYTSEYIVTHDLYNHGTLDSDIALIRVSGNIEFNKKVQPIQLPKKNIGFSGLRVTLTGWGRTEFEWFPNKLQEITLKILAQSVCKKRWASRYMEINRSHICTLTKFGEGACMGDSGGPLVAGDVQIGVVSFGYPCAVGYPDVYARVYTFLSWIKTEQKK